MKDVADDYRKLTIFKLNEHTSIRHTKNGSISWGSYLSPDFKLDYSIYFDWMYWEDHYIELSYRDYDFDGREINLSYRVALTTTPCNYGGERFWFICPAVRNGVDCKRRVGVLYKPKRGCPYFACLRCHNLTYESRNLSGRKKAFGIPWSYPEIMEFKRNTKRIFYKGKLTKRFIKFENKLRQLRKYNGVLFAKLGVKQKEFDGYLSKESV